MSYMYTPKHICDSCTPELNVMKSRARWQAANSEVHVPHAFCDL